jgi:hypothetical protein
MANINQEIYKFNKMPFFKGIFFVLYFFYALNSEAQIDFISDIKSSFKEQPTLDFRIDSRHSFISARIARIVGLKVGANFGDKVKTGLGYNLLWNRVSEEREITNSQGQRESVNAYYRLGYFSPYFEYSFFTDIRWDISILALVGFGRSRFEYTDQYGKDFETDPSGVVLWEPYMTAEYKFWKYFGVGAGVGYRLAYSSNSFARQNLSSPIYVYKLKIYFDQLFKHL